MIFALFGAMAPIGAYVGAAFGALFAQLLWWPCIFFVASIVCVFLAGVSGRGYSANAIVVTD
jgi:hypothetical protein